MEVEGVEVAGMVGVVEEAEVEGVKVVEGSEGGGREWRWRWR